MADLSLTVDAPGAGQAAAEIGRVGTAVERTGGSWDRLKSKLGSGEVLRNAAASAALLGTGAGNVTQKVAALGGALASIPGPVGAVASAVAVGATMMDVFAKNTEQAEKAAAELAATLANLGKQKIEAQTALAGRIGGAAGRLGGGIRGFRAAGGTEEGLSAAMSLAGGDAPSALRIGQQLAGLSSGQRKIAEGTLSDVRSAGFDLSKELVARVIDGIKYETEAMAGPASSNTTREKAPNRQSRFLDAIGADLSNRDQMVRMANAAFGSQSGVSTSAALSRGEAPAVAAGAASIRDAMGGGSTAAMESLKVATDRETNATRDLERTISDLTQQIKDRTPAAPSPQAEASWSASVLFPAAAASP